MRDSKETSRGAVLSRRGFLAVAGAAASVAAIPALAGCSSTPLLKPSVRHEDGVTIFPVGDSWSSALGITESAWLKSTNSNKVPGAFSLQNYAANVVFQNVAVRVMGVNTKGALLIDEQIVIPFVLPEETCCLGVLVGDLSQEKMEDLESVSFFVAGAEQRLVVDDPQAAAVKLPYRVVPLEKGTQFSSSCEVVYDDASGANDFASGVRKMLLGDAVMSAVYVSCVVRDLEGNMLYGYGAYEEGLEAGVPREVAFFGAYDLWNRPETTFDLHVRPWVRDELWNISKSIEVTPARF